jgi:hypothetical protein
MDILLKKRPTGGEKQIHTQRERKRGKPGWRGLGWDGDQLGGVL